MSPWTGRAYPLTMICEVWQVPRSTVYALRDRDSGLDVPEAKKRGPKTELSDEEPVEETRRELQERVLRLRRGSLVGK